MKLSRLFIPVIIICYFALYGALIYSGSGLPYVLDNNETFSSLWHAQSLSNFGINNTKGLADEVFSPHPEASPFVHSHQGNLPRLFAWLIYELGATTAESQIVVTTFSIGLGTMLLCYLFFLQISSPLIALVVSFVFMTDYLLFAQWQVVTYRVWYGFLLFAMLFLIEKIKNDQFFRWFTLLFTVSVCLLYFEFIFAAFVGIWCVLWSIYRMHNNWKLAAKVILAMGSGAVVGFSIFIYQAIAYLGRSDFLRDINITFGSRNNSQSILQIQEIIEFFESKQVIFWLNFQDRLAFMNLQSFFRSIFENNLNAHSPNLLIFIYSLFVCWILNTVLLKMRPRQANSRISSQLGVKKIFRVYLISSFLTAFMGLILYFIYSHFVAIAPFIDMTLMVLLSMPLFLFFVVGLSKDSEHWKTFLYGMVTTVVALLLWSMSNKQYMPVWNYLYYFNGLVKLWPLLLLNILISIQTRTLLINNSWFCFINTKLIAVLPLILFGLISYAIIYYLSPGYIYTGYVARLAPFIVFITDLVYAIVFSMLIYIVYGTYKSIHKQPLDDNEQGDGDLSEAERLAAHAEAPTLSADGKTHGNENDTRVRALTESQPLFAKGLIQGKTYKQAFKEACPSSAGTDAI